MNRITDILKDEESLRQLSELADMLRSGELAEEHEETKSVDNSGNMPDMDMMLKLTGIAGAMNGQDGESLRQGESLLMIPFRLFV